MRGAWLIGVLLAVAAGGAARGAESGPVPVERTPAGYPPEAEGVAGKAVVAVEIAPDGSVAGVEVVSEDPPGYGFGAAAVGAVSKWRFAPGHPGTYRVTINFTPEAADDDTAWLPPGVPPAPRPLRRVRPNYPPSALYRAQTGIVVLIITIDGEGSVTDTETWRETPPGLGFDKATIKAVRKWRFPPGQAGRYGLKQSFGLVHDEEDYERSRNAPQAPPPEVYVAPVYPKADGAAGEVWLLIEIGEGGRVTAAQVTLEKPSYKRFGEAAEAAVRQWRFPAATPPGPYKVFVTFKPGG